jgi:uncharacterized protein YutE (UPF0331/DUF86 family)
MVDLMLINRKLVLLSQSKKELVKYNITSFDAFKKSHKDQKAVEKTLQEMIEICMDIGKHIIADEGFRFPEDGKDIFSALQENGVISDKMADLMRNMVGFRNVVVHLYEKVDLEIVYSIYKKHLNDFDMLVSEINSFLSTK